MTWWRWDFNYFRRRWNFGYFVEAYNRRRNISTPYQMKHNINPRSIIFNQQLTLVNLITKYPPCMTPKCSLLCTQKLNMWELFVFRISGAEASTLLGYSALSQANWFPKLRKSKVVCLQAWTFPLVSTSSLLCLETWGTTYSVTWCHIIEERNHYQYLRHVNAVQNLAKAVPQMQTQKDERSVIQIFKNCFYPFSIASNTKDVCFPQQLCTLNVFSP